MALDEPSIEDAQHEVNGILLLSRAEDAAWLTDAVVDYIKEAWREGFSVSRGGESCC